MRIFLAAFQVDWIFFSVFSFLLLSQLAEFFGDGKIVTHKIAPWKIAHQQILPWVRVRVRLKVIFRGAIFQGAIFLVKTELSPNIFFLKNIYLYFLLFTNLQQALCLTYRSSHQGLFFKKIILKFFEKFTEKHLCQGIFLVKLLTWPAKFLQNMSEKLF